MSNIEPGVNGHAGRHLLLASGDFRGHLRVTVSLAPTVLRHAPDFTITLAIHTTTLQHVKSMLKTYEMTPEEEARLAVVAIGSKEPDFAKNGPAACYFEMLTAILGDQWERLFKGKDDLPVPRGLAVDYFLSQIAERAFEERHPAVRFITASFIPGSAWQLMQLRKLGPETERWHQICSSPGHPDLYAYEQIPCSVPWPQEGPAEMERTANIGILAARHNVLATWSRDVLPQSHEGLQQVLAKGGMRCIDLGASYPPSFWQTGHSFAESDDLSTFLEARLMSHGKSSVIYVSFGTVFWPGGTRPELAETIVRSLIAFGSPFVFVMASAAIGMTPDRGETIKKTIQDSGNLVVGWCDQLKALHHPAVGCFFTHGGTNGLFEALACGLPMIIYPMGAEQVGNAATIVHALDAGFELLQGRDLLKGRKLHNYPDVEIVATAEALRAEIDGVLSQMLGPQGQRKRANAQEISAKIHHEHATKQSGYVREFVDMLG